MNWLDIAALAFVMGWIANPVCCALKAIFVNAWKSTNNTKEIE